MRRLVRWWRHVSRVLGPASSPRAISDLGALPLLEVLGYDVLQLEPYREGFTGAVGFNQQPLAAVRTTSWAQSADIAWRDAVRAGRTGQTRWALVYTGPALRLIDATRTWSRRSLEFDLETVLGNERSTLAMWLLLGADSLSAAPNQSLLERIVHESDAHGQAVCASLGDGVIEALTAIVAQLGDFDQSLTIVYRLLFLLFAEARALVPTWHRVYDDAYTIQGLWRRSVSTQQAPRGLWSALQAIARMAHAGCRAGDLAVTPFNGRLFSPRFTPLAERGRIPDAVVRDVIGALAATRGPRGRTAVVYADLGVEQLGAVYERVLEYEPRRSSGVTILERTSTERKATGSFYTPRSMTEFLVRRTLHPLVHGRSAEEILALRIVDPAMGSGAFLVAACRYLAAAVERAQDSPFEGAMDLNAQRAALRRQVAQRCLYGVDRNPMAVQLARLSLWLTTLASDRPLTFLDHHLLCGDSLTGASMRDLARGRPSRKMRSQGGEASLPLFDDAAADEMAARVLPERFRIARDPDDSPAIVRDKERALAGLTAPGTALARWKAIADLWCASWFWPHEAMPAAVYNDLASALAGNGSVLPTRQRREMLAAADRLARKHQLFHWELEFPEVFFDQAGQRVTSAGFDAVIGNPPWDVLRADTGDRRQRAAARFGQDEELRFFRDAGVYRYQGGGHINRYQLFVERALQITRSGGRLGLILPSGLATDHGSGRLRRALFDQVAIDRVLGFDNRGAIFPIHRDVKFLVMTGTCGMPTERLTAAFGRTRAEWLDELPDAVADDPPAARPIALSRATIARWDPEHLAIPLLLTATDLEILEHAHVTSPPLSEGWGARFGRELNATDDRPHFVAIDGAVAPDTLPIIEGKHLAPFQVMTAGATRALPVAKAHTLLDSATSFGRQRLAYRDVASATNRITLIAGLLPAGTVSTHTVFCLKTKLGVSAQYCLLALLNSLVANYLVRLQVTTHVTTALMARLPVPRPVTGSEAFQELVSLAHSLEKRGVNGDPAAFVRVNTIAAQLYKLTPAQYEHVVATFPLLPEEVRRECCVAFRTATETQRHGGNDH